MKRTGILLCLCLAAAAAVLEAQNQGQGGGSPFPGSPSPPPEIGAALSEMDRAFESPEEEPSPQDDYYLGRAAAARILHTYTIAAGNPALLSYVNKICQAIAINSPLPPAFNGYHAAILDTPEINAFATPGGHIFLTRGLVDCADSEDSLAAVIAHELAHIQLRHAAALINDQRLVNDLSQSADRAASRTGNRDLQERTALFDENIRAMVNTLFLNGFARDQEFEADLAAVRLLRNAGYDPAGLAAILRILQSVQPLRPGGFNATHPSPAARLANLAKVPLAAEGRAARGRRNSRFESLRNPRRPR